MSGNIWADFLSRLFHSAETPVSKQRFVSFLWKPLPEIYVHCITL